MSKVYFYSVSDVLQQEQQDQPIDNEAETQHVSILDCETGRVRKGYVQPNSTQGSTRVGTESPILFPPMSPPVSHRINVSTDSDEILPKLDPLACDINYFYDGLLEHKPLPINKTVSSSKVHTGTSSLGRKGLVSPPTASPCTSCRSPSQFPKTNGSLYESLSLGRRCHCGKRSSQESRSARPSTSSNEDSNSNNVTLASAAATSPSVSLPSPVWTGTAYDSFDDPLSGSRRSFRSVSDLSLSSSSGPTSPWGGSGIGQYQNERTDAYYTSGTTNNR